VLKPTESVGSPEGSLSAARPSCHPVRGQVAEDLDSDDPSKAAAAVSTLSFLEAVRRRGGAARTAPETCPDGQAVLETLRLHPSVPYDEKEAVGEDVMVRTSLRRDACSSFAHAA
jgi:hypothetical protein